LEVAVVVAATLVALVVVGVVDLLLCLLPHK
jgi:hypothetical protein